MPTQIIRTSREIVCAHATQAADGEGDDDPDYAKRDVIWRGIDAGLVILTAVAATTLADIQAKVSVCLVIESDLLTASVYKDVLALA